MVKRRLLVIGAGDIGCRVIRQLRGRYRIYALTRSSAAVEAMRNLEVTPLTGDLDERRSLDVLSGIAQDILHFAPPPAEGRLDTRTRHLLAALGKGQILPQRLLYISTSGVYGDCGGAWIDECRRPHPETERAWRRWDAEQQLRRFAERTGVRVSILRVPGIYSAARLPLDRLEKALPVFAGSDDGYTNHIHAHDLARSAVAALHHGSASRSYHVCDDSSLRLGAYLDLIATHFGLPKPPRITPAAGDMGIGTSRLSFMRESRRLSNRRLKQELGVTLRYPDIQTFLASLKH